MVSIDISGSFVGFKSGSGVGSCLTSFTAGCWVNNSAFVVGNSISFKLGIS